MKKSMEMVKPVGRKLSVTISHPRRSTKRDKGTQTIYRDSEAQTVPWLPDAVFRRRDDNSRITQEWLPPGDEPLTLEDLVTMERTRQKKAWEKTLPRTASKRNNIIRMSCVSAIAENEFAFRESILDAERDERLQLSEQNMRDARERMLMSLKARLENMRLEKSEENSMIINFRSRQFKRKMRKLKVRYLSPKGMRARSGASSSAVCRTESVASNSTKKPSPLLKDEVGFSRYLAEFSGIELLEKQISVSQQAKFARPRKPRSTSKVCSRVLRNAENEFEKLRMARKGKQTEEMESQLPRVPLRKRVRRTVWKDVRQLEKEEEAYQASLLLGKVVKGRAVQTRFLSSLIEFEAQDESDPTGE